MSNAVQTLNKVLTITAKRYPEHDDLNAPGDCEEERDLLMNLLDEIVVLVGDFVEYEKAKGEQK